MKIEIELSEQLNNRITLAAKKRKLSKKRFILYAINRLALKDIERRKTSEELTASLNKFFEENPDYSVDDGKIVVRMIVSPDNIAKEGDEKRTGL